MRHRELVGLLEQQDQLANDKPVHTKFGQMGHGSVVHDPHLVVATRAYKDGAASDTFDAEPNIVIGRHTRIDAFVKLEGGEGLTIGDHVHIASFSHVNIGGGRTIIEDGAAVASGARIVSGGNAPDAISCSAVAPEAEQVLHRRTTVLCKNSCVYAGASIMPGVEIGEGARVLPGAVVTKNVPAFEVWGGVPAKFVRLVRDVTRPNGVRVEAV